MCASLAVQFLILVKLTVMLSILDLSPLLTSQLILNFKFHFFILMERGAQKLLLLIIEHLSFIFACVVINSAQVVIVDLFVLVDSLKWFISLDLIEPKVPFHHLIMNGFSVVHCPRKIILVDPQR